MHDSAKYIDLCHNTSFLRHRRYYLYIKSASGYQPEKGVAIPLTLDTAYKLNCVCNAGLFGLAVQMFHLYPTWGTHKINYKLSVTPYLVFVK